MRLVLLLNISLILSLSAKNQTTHFQLEGKVNGVDTGTLYFGYSTSLNTGIYDSVQLKNGSFTFSGNVKEPTIAFLALKDEQNQNGRLGGPNYTQISIEPGSMNFTANAGEFANAKLTGSESHQLLAELYKKTNADLDLSRYYNELSTTARKDTADRRQQKLADSLLLLSKKAAQQFSADQIDFVRTHPESYLAAHFLQNQRINLESDTFRLLYNRLSQPARESLSGLRIKALIDKEDSVNARTVSIDFKRNDLHNKPFDFAQFKKGKYVLLDFWASWCIPCREESPVLKTLLSKYSKSDFAIVGIAADNKYVARWKQAIKKDGISDWKHVLENPLDSSKETSASLHDLYDVDILPTQVLINDKGVIIGRYGNRGKSFAELPKKLISIYGY